MADGVFLDINPRLNMGLVDKVLADVKRMMRAGGQSAAKSFSTSFEEMSRSADAAFRDMQRGMFELQRTEARVNEMRAQGFKRSSDAMIAAEKAVQAEIARTQKLIANSRDADAAVLAGGSRGKPTERKPLIPIPRGADTAGAAATVGVVGGLAYGARVDARVQSNINTIATRQIGLGNAERPDQLQRFTQFAYQNAGRLGPNSSAQNISQAIQQAEQAGYRGQSALNLVTTSFQESTATGANFSDTLKALDTQLRDVGETTDKTVASLQQMQEASSQNVRALSMAKLDPSQLDEYFKSMHSYEPVLAALSPNANPANLLAQGQAAMLTLMQTGETPQNSGQNLSHLFQNFNMPAGGKAYKAYSQIGGNPQDVANILNTQGPVAAMQAIQAQMAKVTGPDGLIHTGKRFNNDELNSLATDVYNHFDEQTKAFVDANPDIGAGLAQKKSLRKAVDSGQLSASDAQDVLTYSRWRAEITGMNPNIKKGGPADLTQSQFVQQMFGTADMSRTFDILNQNAKALSDRLNSILQGGQQNVLMDSFNQAMKSNANQWHALGDAAGGLAGRMANDLLPVMSSVVDGFRGVIDFLNRHKIVADALLKVMEDVAVAWGAAKAINFFSNIQQAFQKVTKASTDLATAETVTATQITESGVGTKLKTAGTDAEALAAAETKAAGQVTEGASGLKGGFGGVVGKLGILALVVQQASDFVGSFLGDPNAFEHAFTAIPNALQGKRPDGSPAPFIAPGPPTPTGNQPGAGIAARGGLSSIPMGPGQPGWSDGSGKARGGIVGFWTGGFNDPYSQGLMSMPDMGGDSVLGMMPNGKPIGLRGGEGILTPEAVQAIGGKDGVDALNSNPWSNPLKVATTFYGSFAQGVAKYSPYGKYLTATSQTLNSLEQMHDQAANVQAGPSYRAGSYGSNPSYAADMRGIHEAMALNGQPYSWGNLDCSGYVSKVYAAMTGQNLGRRYFTTESNFAALGFHKGFMPGALNIGVLHGGAGGGHMAATLPNGVNIESGGRDSRVKYGHGAHGALDQEFTDHWYFMPGYSTGGVVGYYGGGVLTNFFPAAPAPKVPGGPNRPSPAPNPTHGPNVPHGPNQGHGRHPQGLSPGQISQMEQHLKDMGAAPEVGRRGANPNDDRNIFANPSRRLTSEGKGFGIGGGLIGAMESGAAGMGGPFGAAAQPAFQLINRAIGYGGQLVGIGIKGLMETFLPNDSPAADPSRNIFGKIALGIAGAHPSGKNAAGSHAMQLHPKQDLDAGDMKAKQMPGNTFKFSGDIHNHGSDHKEMQSQINKGLAYAAMIGVQN